jgi:hypothetical protein
MLPLQKIIISKLTNQRSYVKTTTMGLSVPVAIIKLFHIINAVEITKRNENIW